MLRVYEDLQIGNILSSSSFANIAVFGGDQRKITLINITETKQKNLFFDVASKDVNNIVFCPVNLTGKNPRLLLAIFSFKPNYLESKSDLLEMTQILNDFGVSLKNIFSKQMLEFLKSELIEDQKTYNLKKNTKLNKKIQSVQKIIKTLEKSLN